ncbi:MarR family transcriptional regulator [Mycobacterium sp. OTB74]|jgi:DNA-binding MarR family transcriptional regulator|uniref:MarR family winged helix-turn-helix transcriptional regulator n=1 Tax=Mycobacterium sp. OTB74 TaxID=1853452 RepID=UPI0024771C5F|nr:MarR family transcriptional regulator [Mycobacterium sp. OTB74]MDH6245548.1 DNA-binding MarR family transcriptional regulator [Mycobacterium sp. OTB74]
MPQSQTVRREQLAEMLKSAAQRAATEAVMMHQAIADTVGLPTTDLRCLNILRQDGPTTPGKLAAATGLTTGAITRMIDRLLAAGFVQRAHDEQDRRRVLITAVPERLSEIAPHYEPIAAQFDKVTSSYTNDQLELILGLFDRLHDAFTEITTQLRGNETGAPSAAGITAV